MEIQESSKSAELHGTVKLSYSEFSKIPYDGLGHHLVRGVHIITPAPGIKHQSISNYISFKLTQFVVDKKVGTVLTAPVDVQFSDNDGYQPDIIFIDNEKKPLIQEKRIVGPPSLIIEISEDSANADYGWKKEMAEKYSVPEYWVVDIKYQVTEVFALKNDKYVSQGVFQKREDIKTNLKMLEGIVINLNDYL